MWKRLLAVRESIQMEQNATENGVLCTRISIEGLLSFQDEKDVVDSVIFEGLVCTAAGVAKEGMNEWKQDVLLEIEGLYIVEEGLAGLAGATAALDLFGSLGADFNSKFRRC